MPKACALLGEDRGHRDRGEDDAVDLVVEDLLHHALDVADGRRGHEDEDVVALFLQRDRQALDHLGVEVVLEVGDDEADDPAASGDQRARQHVRPVAELGAARRTFSMVRFEAEAPGVKTRLTADWLTPARFATSSDVTFSFAIIVRRPAAVDHQSAVPVTIADASEARKATAPMMSSTRPTRPSLIFSSIQRTRVGIGEGRLGQRRADEGRAEGVDPDAVAAPLDRHRLGEAFDRVLGGAVDRAVDAADMAHLRGDVDERAGLAGRDQPLRHGLGDEVGAADVEVGDGVEVCGRRLRGRRVPGECRRC